MAQRQCQCGSSCGRVGCLDCCDCGAPLAGPIERELRGNNPCFGFSSVSYHPPLTMRASRVLHGAAESLGVDKPSRDFVRHARDVFSEAIEAAEALGL